MSNAVMPLSDYKDTCDKIREKTASTDNIKSGELADKVAEVYEKGKQTEYDRFWDACQQKGARTDYRYAFSYGSWHAGNFYPKYDIKPTGDATQMFAGMCWGSWTAFNLKERLENCGVKLDLSKVTNFYQGFNSAKITVFPELDLTSVTTAGVPFQYCDATTTFEKIKLPENYSISGWFTGCSALVNITLDGIISSNVSFSSSTKLSKASIENIFTCLSDTTTNKTLTLSKTAVNNAFTGGSTGTEWLNLVATKPNWTISLS